MKVKNLWRVCACALLSAVTVFCTAGFAWGAENVSADTAEWFGDGTVMETIPAQTVDRSGEMADISSVVMDVPGELVDHCAQTANLSAGTQGPLSTPSNPGWGRDYRFTLEQYNQGRETPAAYAPYPGMMYWQTGQTSQNLYTVSLYRQEDDGDALVETVEQWRTVETGAYASCFRFLMDNRDSGDYFFTVQARGDGVNYSDSAETTSPVWHYEPPTAKIRTPARPGWDGAHIVTVSADPDDPNLSAVAGYQARWYFEPEPEEPDEEDPVPEEETEPIEPIVIGEIVHFYPSGMSIQLPDRFAAAHGRGYYSVEVRILSGDIAGVGSSEWSQRSHRRLISADVGALTEIVYSVTENSIRSDKQTAVERVRALDFETLRGAMAADQNNIAAAGDIAHLEEITGSQARISIAEDASELFAQENVSVIGAGLNVDVGESVTLNISKPDSETVLPSIYANTVQFSMNLADKNGDDLQAEGKKLSVPVKLTLPVPENISPQYFVLIHHHADGTNEEINSPTLRKINDQWYATFVLGSFSTFTMGERLEYVNAVRTDGGISLDYLFRGGEDGVYETPDVLFCAVYDPGGRILTMCALEPSQTRRNVTLVCESAQAQTVRVFTLGAQFIPTAAVREITLPE